MEAMVRRLAHRGPDAEGFFFHGPAGLGHRRLEVIDLAGGVQPMVRGEPPVALVYNGETYNFPALARQLRQEGRVLRTRSDTEVVLEAYRAWGIEALARLSGMFALGLWDGRRRRLLLARDRMGQKPLYYFQTERVFAFASELKALLAHPECPRSLSLPGLVRYLVFEYVPSPWTILEGVFKLEPASFALFDPQAWRLDLGSYWRIPFEHSSWAWWRPRAFREAAERLRAALGEAVRRRLLADVPLGIFLSGGLDSTTITALAAQYREPATLATFSIGFEDPSFDESSHARFAARFVGTRHQEQVLEPAAVYGLLERLSDLLDEPLGDASVVPTHLLSAFARQEVTVALAGDGGDELFAGYPTFQAEVLARILYEWQPELAKRLAKTAAEFLPVSFRNISFDFKVKQFLKAADRPLFERHQVWLGSFSPAELEHLLLPDVKAAFQGLFAEVAARVAREEPRDWLDALFALYAWYYLAEDILVKTDRASMAVGLEVRAPFLDPEVVALAASVPGPWRLFGLRTKHLLKEAVRGLVPARIRRRPKKGFGIPVGRWLHRELRPLAERLFDPDRIRRQGLLNPWEVQRLFTEHLARRRDNRKKLWTLMAFQLWWDRYA